MIAVLEWARESLSLFQIIAAIASTVSLVLLVRQAVREQLTTGVLFLKALGCAGRIIVGVALVWMPYCYLTGFLLV